MTAGITAVIAAPAQAAGVCRYRATAELTASTEQTELLPVPSTNLSANPDCHMAKGAVSAAVRGLQQNINICYVFLNITNNFVTNYMKSHGYPNFQSLQEDGQFGNMTATAVKAVQAFHNQFGAGLAVDGSFGPLTRRQMWWHFNGGCVALAWPVKVVAVNPNPNP